jgi:hypothetical protein
VAKLHEAIRADETGSEALELVRGLIEQVSVKPAEGIPPVRLSITHNCQRCRVCAARIACDSVSSTDLGVVLWTRVILLGLMESFPPASLPTNV